MSLGRFTNSCNLSVNVCNTWFESQRIYCGKLMQSKSGQAPKGIIEWQNWIQDKSHTSDARDSVNCEASDLRSQQSAHDISSVTWTVWRLACGQQTPHYSLHKSQAQP